MTPKPTLLLCLLVCASLSGCTLCQIAKRTILDEPSEFSWMEDRKQSVETYRAWAERAWREQCSSDPEPCLSRSYVAGFKDGFVDYVYGGGSGEPPLVPPRRFWNMEERNARGRVAATDWFTGYRHGAQVAREEGYRQRALVPSSLFLLDPQEERWRDRPQYAEPLPAAVAAPLPPEFVPPIQNLPLANPNVFEPKRSAPTLPAEETPSAVVPNVGVPEVDQNSAREELPSPPAVPEEREPPQRPKPSESPPPKDVRPPTDIDDIFGSPTRVSEPQVVRKTNYEKVLCREVTAQQARSAFAAAIRSRSAASSSSHANRVLQSGLPPRPVAIPRSEDRAEAMFRRLSR